MILAWCELQLARALGCLGILAGALHALATSLLWRRRC